MAEYIEREAIIGELDEMISNISFTSPYVDEIDRMIEGMERARDCVYNAEAADVVEVVHGRWVYDETERLYSCSECGHESAFKYDGMSTWKEFNKYCPNCGARMDGE